jgi:hypothetical protein
MARESNHLGVCFQVDVAAALQLAGIDAHNLSADLTDPEREKLIRTFTKDPWSHLQLQCQV